MTEPGPWDHRGDAAALRPVRLWPTVALAWRLVEVSLGRAWPIWLMAGLADAALLVLQRLVGGGRAETPDLPTRLLMDLGSALLLAPIGAAGLRTLLQPQAPAWRLDTGFRTYVAAVAAMGFVGSQVTEAAILTMGALVGRDPAQTGWTFLVYLLMWIVAGAATLRLLLWPIGQLLGRRALGLRFAVAAMAGATLPALGADLILSGFPDIMSLIAGSYFYYLLSLPGLAIAAALGAWSAATSVAVAAVVYRTRLGIEAEELAQVFD